MPASKSHIAPAEIMAVVLAREVRDGELNAVGAASQIPMAAIKLAKATHAPNADWFCGGSGAINSTLPTLLDSAADYRNLFGAEYRNSMEDVVDLEMRGRTDAVYYGGIQVDKYGNINMVCVGDYENPKMRGPGSVGLALAGSFGRTYIYLQHHDPRILVDKVDFISGPGHMDGSGLREEMALETSKGPCLLVTPLCVMDFADESRRARLISTHPGVTVDEVLEKTGFEPLALDPVPETEPPTDEELRILREEIDHEGVLRRLIG